VEFPDYLHTVFHPVEIIVFDIVGSESKLHPCLFGSFQECDAWDFIPGIDFQGDLVPYQDVDNTVTIGVSIGVVGVWRDASRRATSPRAVRVGCFARLPASRVVRSAPRRVVAP